MGDNEHIKNRQYQTKKDADKLATEIREKAKELEKVQEDCSHPDEKICVKDIGRGEGRSEFRKVCGICGKAIGYPSQKEITGESGNG